MENNFGVGYRGSSLLRWVGRVLLVAVYLSTNIVFVHASESHFWGERRRAARAQSISSWREGQPLFAGLPGNLSPLSPESLFLDPQPGNALGSDSSLNQSLTETADRRIHLIAQSILPFGTVRFVQESKKLGAPLVLHIQDVHGNLEAQQNISEMVLALARNAGVRLVGMEGAWGAFAVDEFRPYPDQEIVKKVGHYFLKKDLIAGPEFAGLASEIPLTLWGIEDPLLYQANVDAVKESLARHGQAAEFLASLTSGLATLKKSIYSKDLMAFDQNRSLYDQNIRGLGEYVQTLVDFDGREGTALAFQVPNVVRFLSAFKEEKSLDFSAVERERQDLVKALSDTLTQEELQDLTHRSIELRAGAITHNAYHLHLRNLCAVKGVSLGQRPSLLAYMHYVAASEEIERDALLNEMAWLEQSAQDGLIKTREQKTLVALSRDTLLLKKLFANGMTPDEWNIYQHRKNQIHDLEGRYKTLAPGPHVSWPERLTGLVSPFEAFCARAMDRNGALTKNLMVKMGKDKQDMAVLVAGGFHTDGLMDSLSEQEASVLVLTPKIGPVAPQHRYLDVFAQDPIPLEKMFTGEPIALKTVCGLSGQETSRSVTDGLHLGIVGSYLQLKEDLLQKLHLRQNQMREKLQQVLNDLSALVPPLLGMELAVSAVGNNGSFQIDGRSTNDQAISMNMMGGVNGTATLTRSKKHSGKRNDRTAQPLSDQQNHLKDSKPYFSAWPSSALPGFVYLFSRFFGAPVRTSVEVHANILQSALFGLILFSISYAFPMEFIDPLVLHTGTFFLFSHLIVELRQAVYRYDFSNRAWLLVPIGSGATKQFLRLAELIFNAPLLLFFLSVPGDLFLSNLVWGANSLIASVALRVGFNVHARQRKGRSTHHQSHDSISDQINELINDFQDGKLKKSSHHLPVGMTSRKLKTELTRIAQEVVQKKLANTPLEEHGYDGIYRVYYAPDLNVMVKFPEVDPVNNREHVFINSRIIFDAIKNHLGGVYAKSTLLDLFTRDGGKTYHPDVVVQEGVWKLPTVAEKWSLNGEIKVPYETEIYKTRIDFDARRSERQERYDLFVNKMGQHGFSFSNLTHPENHLGLTVSNQLVAYQLGEITLTGEPNGKRVHDVFENDVRAAHAVYLRGLLEPQKPHSLFSVPTLKGFYLSFGLSDSVASVLAKGMVAVVIPLAETLAYGLGTPVIAASLASIPFALGFAPLAPLLVGFLSAVIHSISWTLQGEKVSLRDFMNWWAMGVFYSLPFALFPSSGWAGELPWMLSGYSHVFINSFIVAGTAKVMGDFLGFQWLADLKPGSLLGVQGRGETRSEILFEKERGQLRSDIALMVNSVSIPLSVEESPRSTELMFHGRTLFVTVGKGSKFEGWIDDQIVELQVHDETLKPIRVIDSFKSESYSFLVTEVLEEKSSIIPNEPHFPLKSFSQEGSVQALVRAVSEAYQETVTKLDKSFHLQLMNSLTSQYLGDGDTRLGLPSKSLMATAAAVVLAALKSDRLNSSRILAYLEKARSFQDLLAINGDVLHTENIFNRFAESYLETAHYDFSQVAEKHGEFIRFMNDIPQGEKPKKTTPRPPEDQGSRVRVKASSPVPVVLPLNLQTTRQGDLDLSDLLLNGGGRINLDLLFRSYQVSNDVVVPLNAEAYRGFIRQQVKANWGKGNTKEQWLSTLRTQDSGSVGLMVTQHRNAKETEGTLRWWALGEIWLAVATPQDWLNWRYYVVLLRERVLFRQGARFLAKDRLGRAAFYGALLRTSGNSILVPKNGNQSIAVAQKFDVDLLLGAAGSTGKDWNSLLADVFRRYNGFLEQWTRVDLWRQFAQTQGPDGMTLFDVDLLLSNSEEDRERQKEVASALAGVLLSTNRNGLQQKLVLVTSANDESGATVDGTYMANRLVRKYGILFDRIKTITVASPQTVSGLISINEENEATIHLAPLFSHLNLTASAQSVQFLTHDENRVDTGGLAVNIKAILTLADHLQKFFKLHTFLQTNA
ncbi:MAG: hypothetical protein JNK54_08125 [Elusimicrobia bacterium]|jgi:hypothetical protein|nr:hypothetical protein [Elusimicrobiota bacterium]